MKNEELIKKITSNEITLGEDEFFKCFEEVLVEEAGYSKKEAEYSVKLFRDSEFCKKETGHSFNELCLMEKGFTAEQASYIENNPCIAGPREECNHYKNHKSCLGCTYVNGFLYWKTKPDEK